MEGKEKENIHILVVDDEPGMRDMLSHELGMLGFQVMTASDGAEAVEKVRQQKFDLIISDVKMPRMDGLTALEEIKKIDPNVEVIMATGFGTIETAITAMKKGAYDFIQKPFNLDEVNLLIEKALEKSELKALIGLYESSRALFSTVKLPDLLAVVMDLIKKVLRADQGSIMLLNDKNKLYIACSTAVEKRVAEKVALEIGERIAGFALKQRRGMILVNGLHKYPEFAGIETNSSISSSIVIPLIYQEELLGVLNVSRGLGKKIFDPADFRNASIFASQVSQAVENAKLYQVLEHKIEELKAAYKMLEETKDRLVESEKLASIGKLVAGVAHELNNPLTAVIGYSELLIQSDIKPEEKEQLKVVYEEAKRCRRIIQDLLIFARRREPVLEAVDFRVLLEETLKAFSLELEKNGIQVSQKLADVPAVYADACQLKQVFMNIVKNSIDALSEVERERRIEITLETEGWNARIHFSDNGCGIEEKNLSKIFDPFFSTKKVGKGTGLGLSLAYGIVKQHAGKISVQSVFGQGTMFTVELPLKPAGAVASTKASDAGPHLNGVRVLIVDDEEAIRKFLCHILSMQGFQVEAVEDGEAALSKIQKENFDIILSDYLMPKLDGRGLYEKVKALKPSMSKRFVYMTGHADGQLLGFFEENKLLYLLKPFTPQELIPLFQKAIKP